MPDRPGSVIDGLGDDEKRVYEALPGRGSTTVRELVRESGLTVGRVQGALAILELEQLVIDVAGDWKLRRTNMVR
ncbi:DNA protecting protein DprA [Mycobacteroides abscessus subsp. abscessus]|nr:DNA protecting protein DprA [Mycobacteroides abscessus subsp. abscessus]